MNLCFNRLGEEFTLSRNVVDLIPVEHGEESCVSWIQARFSWKAIKKLGDAPVSLVQKRPSSQGGRSFVSAGQKTLQLQANCSPFQTNSDISTSSFPHPFTLPLFFLQRGRTGKRNCEIIFKTAFPIGYNRKRFYCRFFQEKKKPTDNIKWNSSAFGVRKGLVLLWVLQCSGHLIP